MHQEEVASKFLSPFIKRYTYDPNAEAPTTADYLMAFGGGAVGSAIFGGGKLALDLSPSLKNNLQKKAYVDVNLDKAYDEYFTYTADDERNGLKNPSAKTTAAKTKLDKLIVESDKLNKR